MKKVYLIWYTPTGLIFDGWIASSTAFRNRDLANDDMKLHYSDRPGYSVQEFTLTLSDSAEQKNYEPFDEVLRDLSSKDLLVDAAKELGDRLEEYSTGGEQAQRKVIAAIGRAVLALLTEKIG
jgi:hypothetical protein